MGFKMRSVNPCQKWDFSMKMISTVYGYVTFILPLLYCNKLGFFCNYLKTLNSFSLLRVWVREFTVLSDESLDEWSGSRGEFIAWQLCFKVYSTIFESKFSSGDIKCSVFCGHSCSGCVGCPWGWFANPPHLPRDPQVTINQTLNAQCQPCTDTFDAYDWLFVIFHILCALLLHYQAKWILGYQRTNEVLICSLIT